LEHLVDICQNAINRPEEKKEGRRKMREVFHSNPGSAGRIAADILGSISPVCSTKSRKWAMVKTMSKNFV